MAIVVGGTTVTGTQTLLASVLTGTASAINGSNITNISGGKLLQVQNADFTSTNTTVSAASFGATEVTDQITPSATSSKILVMMSLTLGMYEGSGTGNHCQVAIYKQVDGGGYSRVSYGNADNSFDGQSGFGSGTEINSSRFVTLQFLDSPNTTSAVDYKLYIRLSVASGGGDNVNTGPSNLQRSVTLMEIGA
jgi:hypothetical protein